MLHQVGDKGDGLDGFAEPHFISQDAVEIVVVQGHHPLEPLNLNNREESMSVLCVDTKRTNNKTTKKKEKNTSNYTLKRQYNE